MIVYSQLHLHICLQCSIKNLLKNNASDEGNPLGIARDSGESSGEASGASGTGTETNNSNLIVSSVVVETQRAARVTLTTLS